MNLEAHVDTLAEFHRLCRAAGLPDDLTSVLTIDISKALIAGALSPNPPSKTSIQDAAKAKRERREAELAEAG